MMIRYTWSRSVLLISIISLLSEAALSDRASADQPGIEDAVVYENAERTFQTRITRTTWTIGPLLAVTSLPSESRSNPFSESISHPIIDCSDSTYRCVHAWSRTLAIPRAGLAPRATYSKDGVIFDVHQCFRRNRGSCQVALVSARCEQRSEDGPCEKAPEPPRPNPKFAYVVYFFFNDDFGITAMGTTDRLAPTASARRAIATQSIL